jgi:hypothetical protein
MMCNFPLGKLGRKARKITDSALNACVPCGDDE